VVPTTSTTTTTKVPTTSTTTTTNKQTSTTTTTTVSTTGTPLPDCYPNWTATPFASIPYNTGNLVSYAGNNYVVGYQGAAGPPNAAAGSGWTLKGPCNGTGFTFKPYTTPGLIGYWTQWSPYSRKQNAIDALDLTGFTGINYAFVNADASGNLQSFDTNADLNWLRTFAALRYKYPQLKSIVSIGGWSGSRYFSAIAASASATQAFVKNVHTFLDTNGFDGVDLDWEYPGGGGITCNTVDKNDAANFVNLLAALRAELGPNRSISLAVSAETVHYVDASGKQRIPDILKYANYAQIMSYDFYGSWTPNSDFNSPLNSPAPNDPQEPAVNNNGYSQPLSQANAVAAWIKAGASPSQLTNGLAFYGRSWSVQSKTNNGLYQACTGSVNGGSCPGIVGDYLDAAVWCDPCNECYHSGVWMYNNIRGQTNSGGAQSAAPLSGSPTTASNGWSRQYFDFAQSPTLYTASYNNQPTFISYDDPVSIQAKAAWAKSQQLGGTMIWELSQDYNL
ncbi:UNVERIFIED_CONTAM: hypothetical protein HDU68_006762, partial [Siphonaria sp. JEL0065]